jgi:hypothetical protein
VFTPHLDDAAPPIAFFVQDYLADMAHRPDISNRVLRLSATDQALHPMRDTARDQIFGRANRVACSHFQS